MFKVGDIVKVKQPSEDLYKMSWNTDGEMDKYIGGTFRVERVIAGYRPEYKLEHIEKLKTAESRAPLNRWHWLDEDLELVPDKAEEILKSTEHMLKELNNA